MSKAAEFVRAAFGKNIPNAKFVQHDIEGDRLISPATVWCYGDFHDANISLRMTCSQGGPETGDTADPISIFFDTGSDWVKLDVDDPYAARELAAALIAWADLADAHNAIADNVGDGE